MRGEIHIGATGSILTGRLAELLAVYRAQVPEVKAVVHEQPPAQQIQALLDRRTVALAELRDDEHVMLRPDSSDFAQYLQQCCVAAGFLPRVSQQVVDSHSIPALIAAGFGVALVPAAIQRASRPEIVFRRLRAPAPVADVYAVHRSDETAPVVHRFLHLTRETLADTT